MGGAGQHDHDAAVELCHKAYQGLPTGMGPAHTMVGSASNANSNEMVYGEMTYSGMRDLHDSLQLQHTDVLYDLGSGVGKFVLYCACRNACASSAGVEVGLKRHATADMACTRLEELLREEEAATPRAQGAPQQTLFHAILGDVRQPLYRDANVIVICNIMFGALLNSSILANILSKCPACATIASIVQLHHPRLAKRKVVSVPCTWAAKGVSWTLYTVLPPPVARMRTIRHDLKARPPPATPWQRPPPAGSALAAAAVVGEWARKPRPGTSSGAEGGGAVGRIRALRYGGTSMLSSALAMKSRPSTSMHVPRRVAAVAAS